MPKIYDLHTPFGDYKAVAKRSTYSLDGSLAVWLEDEHGEPLCKVTVNIDSPIANKFLAFVDTNNYPYIEGFLKETGLAMKTHVTGHSGFCEYPLYAFDIGKIEEAK